MCNPRIPQIHTHFRRPFLSEVFLGLGAVTVAGAVEAVGADLALGHADALDEVFELGKLQGGESEATGYLGDHALVLGRIGLCVLLQISLVVALEVADDATGDKLQVALRGGEADEGTAVDEGWAADAAVYLLGSVLEEGAHVVAQLCAAYYGVVAEHYASSLEQRAVGDELHLCYEVAAALVAGCERAGPRGRVLQHGTLIGYALALGVA